MRTIVAFIASIVVCLGVASAQTVAVVSAPANGAVFDGMSPVSRVVKGNLTAAKVIGSYSAVPTAPKTFINRPVILDAHAPYGSVAAAYGGLPHHRPHHRPHHVVVAHPNGITVLKQRPYVPPTPPQVFTSPQTNTLSNLPGPIPAPYVALPTPFGLNRPPTRSERRAGRQIGKLVQMIMIADTKGSFAQVLSLGTTLRRVVRRIGSNNALTVVAGNALAVVNPIIARAGKYLPHDAHQVKKIIQGLNTKEDRLIAKYKRAAKKIADEKKAKKAALKATDTVNALKAKVTAPAAPVAVPAPVVKAPVVPAPAPAPAPAPVVKAPVVPAPAPAPAPAPVVKAPVAVPAPAPVVKAPVVDTKKESVMKKIANKVAAAKQSSTAATNEKLQKYVMSLGKEIHSLKKTIQGNQIHLRKLTTRNTQMEKIIVDLTKKVAVANRKYEVLSKQGTALTSATKRAIGTISNRMKQNGQTIKKVVSSKKKFKKSVMTALATLEEHLHKLQSSSNNA